MSIHLDTPMWINENGKQGTCNMIAHIRTTTGQHLSITCSDAGIDYSRVTRVTWTTQIVADWSVNGIISFISGSPGNEVSMFLDTVGGTMVVMPGDDEQNPQGFITSVSINEDHQTFNPPQAAVALVNNDIEFHNTSSGQELSLYLLVEYTLPYVFPLPIE